LRTRTLTRLRRPLRGRGRGRGGVLKHLRASLLEILEHVALELLRVWQALQARDFGGQLKSLRDEALIFAIEQKD
jgi:hypothetical protein